MTGVQGMDDVVHGTTEPEPEAVILRDGTRVIIRPIRPDDATRLQALFARLSQESVFYRFLGLRKELSSAEAERLANVDYQDQMALVATREQNGKTAVIGVARYAAIPGAEPGLAEAAVVIEDRHQRQGLGTLLLSRLVTYARGHGIRALLATVRQDNDRILRFIQRTGLPTESRMASGVWELRVELEGDPDVEVV